MFYCNLTTSSSRVSKLLYILYMLYKIPIIMYNVHTIYRAPVEASTLWEG